MTARPSHAEQVHRHHEQLQRALPAAVARLGWPAEMLRLRRTRLLRALLPHALEASPFHGQRLRGLDVDRIDEADLGALPTMTKADLMDGFDEVVTDPRVRFELVADHLVRQ